jgi:hypothetical protein
MTRWLTEFYQHAKGKLTTWLALGITGLSQLADHAEELVTQAPTLKPFLPSGAIVEHALHAVLSVLGVLVVWSRIRRLLRARPESPSPAASTDAKA